MSSELQEHIDRTMAKIERNRLLIDNEEKCKNKNKEMIEAYELAIESLERSIHNYKYK